MQTILIAQSLITLLVAGGFGMQDSSQIWAAFYGGGIAMLNAFSLHRRVNKAAVLANEDAVKGMIILYLGAVQRFVATMVLFGIGIKLLVLAPAPMIIAFAMSQFGILFNRQSQDSK